MHAPPASFRERLKGFTLVELLVVTAVVAIIAALAFPVFSSIRQRAGIAGCLGNLRSLGVAMQGYMNENRGFYPQSNPVAGGAVWAPLIASYIPCDYAAIWGNPALIKKTPLFCPAEKEVVQPYYCYSMNREFDVSIYGETATLIHQTSVVSPSQYVLLCDSFKSAKIYTDQKQKMVDWTGLARRHGGFPNFLYADWHAAPYTGAIIGLKEPGGQEPHIRAMWEALYRPPQ